MKTYRVPLRGCRYLQFRFVKNELDPDISFWSLWCEKRECTKWKLNGGCLKTCLTEPYMIHVKEEGD